MTAPDDADDDLRELIANSWPLQEAVRRTAKASMLAALHRELIDAAAAGLEHEPVEWWHWTDPPPPPTAISPRPPSLMEAYGRNWLIMPGAIESAFIHRLESGELAYWGRPGLIIAPYARGPLFASVRVLSWWQDGGTLLVGEQGLPFYAARVEQVIPRDLPSVSEADIERWVRQRYDAAGRLDGADKDHKVAERYFGRDISRARFRKIHGKVLKERRPDLLRPGRR